MLPPIVQDSDSVALLDILVEQAQGELRYEFHVDVVCCVQSLSNKGHWVCVDVGIEFVDITPSVGVGPLYSCSHRCIELEVL